jgi:peptidoglycan-N-acetylglucosamine deacetylase
MSVRRLSLAALILVVAAAAVVAARRRSPHERPASVAVTVAGRRAVLPNGTTLSQASAMLGVHPRAGNLRDVNGRVLRLGIAPGRILLDGRAASGRERLRDGDRVVVVDGHDRTEPVVRREQRVPGGTPSDPQFTVNRIPGEQLIVRGAVSHELVASRFRPTGPAKVPRTVALTFDDGPSPQFTPRILRALVKLRAHATFFVIGYLAQASPDLVRREVRLGMAVGNHTYNHPQVPPFDQLPQRLLADEIELGARILAGLGVRPSLFRPPGGSTSARIVKAAAAQGQRVVLWSVDPGDWIPGVSPRQIARSVLSAVRPGSIVILHDGGGDRSATLAALPRIVRGIRRRHLRLVTLADEPPVTTVARGSG